ncbi:NAD(P)-dependent oxidoreductase [Variovorax sp. OV084]|jgi:3-hydroxyisobutyrate dehydrogenase-like beta-hydroxyacid dehydrogenase|uniref:NAD(P)-dependent oxidoreductase n=1 Tax=Variovorax sp. OV084 TaxID=1882777 RepID=UPI0008C365A4|nr:NAD(P)-dependent oxidoreductase [Variovorax sp. OV084]SET81267.1 3-hydroxyisobutyrate dehydrogenase [Variovorax sp. OV084]
MKNIGMIGIGLMGHGVAQNILKHGYALTVLEHSGNQPLDQLKAAGATTQTSAAKLAAASEVVILCVTGTPQVEAVLLGDGGVLQGLRQETVIIDCSTAVPSSTERIAEAVKAAGGLFLDAPMTRTPKEAAEGRLNLLVGGDEDLFNQCRPLLATFAENINHAGPIGAGHRMKLLHNYVSLGFVALLCEAAACAQRSGIASEVFVDILAKGGGGGAALERLRPYLASGDSSALRFAMSNAKKDLGYYNTMANDTGAVSLIAEAVHQTFSQALDEGGSNAMVLDLVPLLAAATGSTPQVKGHP